MNQNNQDRRSDPRWARVFIRKRAWGFIMGGICLSANGSISENTNSLRKSPWRTTRQRDPIGVSGRTLAALLLLIVGVGSFTVGCDGGEHRNRDGETTLQRVRRTGVVRIAYANEAPYGYKDPKTGRITGEAPEIAAVILKQMGVERFETTLTDFGQLIPGLNAGRFDLIAAGMYITPQRCEQISFSNPTYAIGEAFLVRDGNPKGLHGFEDVLENPDARLGVVGGTVELQIAEELRVPEARIVVFPDNAAALAGLKAGRIDAFAGTALTVQDLLTKTEDPDLERADPFHQPRTGGRSKNYGGFGFRKADTDFLVRFNECLEDFIGSPEHLGLVRPFGFTANELPGDITAHQICGPSHGESNF